MAKERKPAKNQRVTIKDVAAAARVSPMTVSNVLNGKNQFVSERTRKIVEREIDRLNYRIQQHARSLRVSHRRSVGIVIVDDGDLGSSILFDRAQLCVLPLHFHAQRPDLVLARNIHQKARIPLERRCVHILARW